MPDTTVADARTLLRSWCVATAVEEVPTPAALHRTLARRVRAESDVRPEPTAAMDGIAVRAADTPGTVAVTGEVRAGASGADTAALAPGAAVWISTGAVLPPGADAVVRRERLAADGDAPRGRVTVPGVEPGTDVRGPGADLALGTVVADPGTRLGPAHLGVFSTLGVTHVPVHVRPRVAVLTTGDEVVRPSETPGPGQVRDANGPWLAARLHELGAEVVPAAGAGDDPDLLATVLADAAAGADLVVTTGGASVGRHDRTTEVLEALGEGRSLTLPLRPGRPCVLGRVGTTPVLGLPGTPLAALVVFELVGTAAVRTLSGRQVTDPPVVSAPLLEPIDARADGRTTVVPAFVDRAGVRLAVHRGSSQLVGAAGADGLALLDGPADVGADVPVLLLRP